MRLDATLREAQRKMEEELSKRKLEKERAAHEKALQELPAKQRRLIRIAGLAFLGFALMGGIASIFLLGASFASPIVIPFVLVAAVGSFMALLPNVSIQAGEALGRLWDRIRDREPTEPGLELPPPVDTSYRNVADTDAPERDALLGSRRPSVIPGADAKPVGYGATASAGAVKMGGSATETRVFPRQGLPPRVTPTLFSRSKNPASAARLATLASSSSTPITPRGPGLPDQ